MATNRRGTRGQSSTTGVILLVAVTLLLGTTVALTFGSVGDSLNEEAPQVRFDVTAAGSDLVLEHVSGDTVRATDLTLLLVQGDTENRFDLETYATTDRLTSGTSVSVPHGLTQGEAQVRLVHEPSKSILVSLSRTIENVLAAGFSSTTSGRTVSFTSTATGGTPGAPALSVADSDLSGFSPGNQDFPGTGTATTTDGGRGVDVTGNRWIEFPYEYDLTTDTVVEFEYRSSRPEGEIHGLSFENDDGQDSTHTLRVYGTQNYGGFLTDVDGNTYTTGDGWRTYQARLGDVSGYGFFGTMDRLVVVNDDDTGGQGETHVRNIRLIEQGADYQYQWEFGDGTVSNQPDPTHTYSSSGTYTVTLTVRDANGATATVTKDVTVS